MFKETLRRCLMEFLTIIKIVFNVFYRKLLRALLIVQRKVRQTAQVVVERALSLAVNRKTLRQLVL